MVQQFDITDEQHRFRGDTRWPLLLAVAAMSACGDSAADPSADTLPNWYCGERVFAIALEPGERVEREDPGMDFLIYRLTAREETTVIYAGNAPQPGGTELETGLQWPAIIAVHGEREIAGRIRLGDDQPAHCLADPEEDASE